MQTQQKLPTKWAEREALREKGQFWTPEWVAEAMVSYVLNGASVVLLDPAVGAGAFFHAAKKVAAEQHVSVRLVGTELDPLALEQASRNGLTSEDLKNVSVRDFVLDPPEDTFGAIVANPPYIRHHRISADTKALLRQLACRALGHPIDARAGYHIYFLIRALQLLHHNGRLAFIMPADTCEGVFAPQLWRWITENFCLNAVITFSPDASPFPGVDTNAVVFLIQRSAPSKYLHWARVERAGTIELRNWVESHFDKDVPDLVTMTRLTESTVLSGLSRSPVTNGLNGTPLIALAKVMRGIATGDNEFFFLTSKQISELNIPQEFFVRAIGRTRDIKGDEITVEMLEALDAKGRPTFLLSPDGRPLENFPQPLKSYLLSGEARGLPIRPLIASRNPWYKMETRHTPPFLFSYLGRRNARFIRNQAGVVPLTGFLCVYPRAQEKDVIDQLWLAISDPRTIENLKAVGKSYGGGAIKVEPRALERLTVPTEVLSEVGLEMTEQPAQERLFN